MSVPFNNQDYERLLKLAAAVNDNPGKAEIHIWISERSNQETGCYTSLEIKGYLPPLVVAQILDCQLPTELTAEEMAINKAMSEDQEA